MTALYLQVPTIYFFSYFIFFSALIVTIRSDIETMLISRLMTLFLIPLGFVFSYYELLPISLLDSIAGAILGYLFLFITAHLFLWITGKDGMGQGDLELLAFIGAFTGLTGCWISLLIGSVLGSLIGMMVIIIKKGGRSTRIPFGPFLAAGAMLYVLFSDACIRCLLGLSETL